MAVDTYIPLYDGDDRTDRKILYHGNADNVSHSPTAFIVGSKDALPVQDAFTPVGALNVNAPADYTAARTLTPPAGATRLLIQTINRNLRYTLDGTTPTATVGFRLTAGNEPVIIPVLGATVVKLIEESATASVQFQWGA